MLPSVSLRRFKDRVYISSSFLLPPSTGLKYHEAGDNDHHQSNDYYQHHDIQYFVIFIMFGVQIEQKN